VPALDTGIETKQASRLHKMNAVDRISVSMVVDDAVAFNAMLKRRERSRLNVIFHAEIPHADLKSAFHIYHGI
jgi:hypothetical protein